MYYLFNLIKLFFYVSLAQYIVNNFDDIYLKMENIIKFLKAHKPYIVFFCDQVIEEGKEGKEGKEEKDADKQEDATEDKKEQLTKQVASLFENKYLDAYNKLPNNFYFTDEELVSEQNEFIKIKLANEKMVKDGQKIIKTKLLTIADICDNNGSEMSEENKTKILKYFEIEDEYDDDPDSVNFDELFVDLVKEKTTYEEELKIVEQSLLNDEEIREKARQYIINVKLDKMMNNYILENTPLGNIYMRYNNDKKSFEYFSNNTIPYRYLEPVGRKYVITFCCKPIFIDLENELKRAEIKYDEDKKREENERLVKPLQKNIMTPLKSYNKENMNTMVGKNRSQNFALPPQIQARLPNVKNTSEKQLLKESANRYTCEGRLSNFSPLKHISKKIVNKNLEMSFADFKKMQNMVGK